MSKYDVVGIGNAMVDILSRCEEGFLHAAGIEKGIMQLIDMPRAVDLYARVGPAKEISGGSAANTIAVIAALGGKTAYVGKVKNDQLGQIFVHDMRAQGATFDTPLSPADARDETGRCIVLVTPDGERSLNTYLGVSEHLGPEDIDVDQISASKMIYLEGYRFDGPDSRAAFAKANEAAKAAGAMVSLTLSDPFCVERHRDAFRRMIKDDVDLLFCNRAEILAMYQTDDYDAAMLQAASEVSILACTDGEHGAHVLAGGNRWHAPADDVEVVDGTGAGDAFAGAFLWGHTNGQSLETSLQMACIAGSEMISHIGARPEADLKALYSARGLL